MRAAMLVPVVLLVTGWQSAAARASEPPAPAAPPTFQADTQVVLLDLVARDGRGRPVPDLGVEELQLFEDGKRCEVRSFRLVRAARPDGAAALSGSPEQSPAGPEPGRSEPATPSQANLVVLLFDRLLIGAAPYARQGALELLDQRFPPNTWFAVFKVYTRGTRVVQPFTASRERLRAAVLAATTGDDASGRAIATAPADLQPLPLQADPRTPPDAPPATPGTLEAISERVQSNLGEIAQRVQAFDTLYGLQAIARGLAPVRGRKSILYFAEGRDLPESTTVAYDSTVSEANRANVTIHTVDVRGLTAARVGGRSAFDSLIGQSSASGRTGGGRGAIGNESWTVATENGDRGGGPLGGGPRELHAKEGSLLDNVAADTGGLAIRDTNDLGAGLARVVDELGEYYEVVYAPANPVPDGRFRRIQARVTRTGVRVRTRAGYFATPASAPTLLAYELPLTAAIASSDAPHDLPHQAGLLHFGASGRERDGLFVARVALADVLTVADEAKGVYRAHLRLLGFVRDASGRAVARFSQDWPIEGPLGERARLGRSHAAFRSALSLPPGRYTLETAVQDVEARRLGVERAAVEVPGVTGSLALGNLVLVRQAAPAAATAAPDPLQVGGVAIEPQLGTPVLEPPMRELPLFLPVYGADPGAQMELEVWRGGERLATTSPALPAPEPGGRIAWIGSLPAKSLAPGRYQLVARVRQAGQEAEERAAFEIRDAEAVAPPVPADVAPLLERAGRYVLDYEQKFQNIVAEERYTQRTESLRVTTSGLTLSCSATACRRTTRADVVFVRLAGAIPWGCFRDVFEMDGTRVRQPDSRLETLFKTMPTASAQQRARRILDDSARYNIGPAVRNINFPTLSLLFLHPANQARFAWKRGGKRWFGSTEAIELGFEEIARPTLVDQDGRGDLPASGRFWIDPSRGTVARAEVKFRFEPARARAYVATEYAPDPRLALWVPSEMREEYDDLPGAKPRLFGTPSEATARYSNFRRFSVTTDETATLPGEPQP